MCCPTTNAPTRFRWVTCQIDHLCELSDDAARRRALDTLPPDLNATYDRILERVNQQPESTRVLVQRTLQWITGAGPCLSEISALCEAISINIGDTSVNPEAVPDVDELLRRCSSLTRLSSNAKCLEPAHFTVTEYLSSINPVTHPHLARYRREGATASYYKATTCLTYLCMEDFEHVGWQSPAAMEALLEARPFYKHAAEHWVTHLRRGDACVERTDSTLPIELLQRLFSRPEWSKLRLHETTRGYLLWEGDVCHWSDGKRYDDMFQECIDKVQTASPLHIAASLHLHQVMPWLVENGSDVNLKSVQGTPLHWALLSDSLWLLGSMHDEMEEGCWPDDGDERLCTIRSLADLGADLQACTRLQGWPAQSVLSLALASGCHRAILDLDAQVDRETIRMLEAFNASNQHHVVEDFISHVQDRNLCSTDTATIKQMRSLPKKSSDTQLSLVTETEGEVTDSDQYQLAQQLSLACSSNAVAVLERLFDEHQVDATFDLNPESDYTLAQHAVLGDAEEALAFLFARGAKIRDHGFIHSHPLHACLRIQYKNALGSMLLEADIGVDSDDEDSEVLSCDEDDESRKREATSLSCASASSGDRNNSSTLLANTTELDATTIAEIKGDAVDEGNRKKQSGRTILHLAALCGATRCIPILLEHGEDLFAVDAYGWDALSFACYGGHLEAVQLLVTLGSQWHVCDYSLCGSYEGTTACLGLLELAAASNNVPVVQYVIENLPAKEDDRLASSQLQPLWMACWHGSLEVARWMLDRGADLKCIEVIKGFTTLHAAAARGHRHVVEMLLDRGSDIAARDCDGRTAMFHASRATHIGIMEALERHNWAKQGLDPGSEEAITKLHERMIKDAISSGALEAVQSMARRDIVPKKLSCGCPPSLHAQAVDQVQIAEVLRAVEGAKLEGTICNGLYQGFTPYDLAMAFPSQLGILRSLLESPNSLAKATQHSPFHPLGVAIVKGNDEALRYVLEHEQLIAPHSIRGPHPHQAKQTPACAGMGDYLLGPPVARPQAPFRTTPQRVLSPTWAHVQQDSDAPLHLASRFGNLEAVHILLHHGAMVDGVNDKQQTPLHFAAAFGHTSVLSALLGALADINAQDNYGNTAIMVAAAREGHRQATKTLLDCGANVSMRNIYGCSALHAAAQQSDLQIVELLQSHCSVDSSDFTEGNHTPFSIMANSRDATVSTYALHRWQHCHADEQRSMILLLDLHDGSISITRRVAKCAGPQAVNMESRLRGHSPLYYAASCGQLQTAVVLVRAGALVNLEGGPYGTALMAASAYGRLPVLRFLVRNGGLLCYTKLGKWHSAVAAARHHPKIVRWLLVERWTEQPKLGWLGDISEAISASESAWSGGPDVAVLTTQEWLEQCRKEEKTVVDRLFVARQYPDGGSVITINDTGS